MSQADWDRLQYYSRRVKAFNIMYDDYDPEVHPSIYVRLAELQSSAGALFPSLRRVHCYLEDRSISHIFLFQSPLLDSLSLTNIGGFENTVVGPFFATLSSSPQMLTRIVLDSGRMSVDFFKESIIHFKRLQFLSVEVFMIDSSLWEILGTLPSLKTLTLKANDPESHPVHAPENSNSQSGLKYFTALEDLNITGSLFLIQHLLNFIDSPFLKSIGVYPCVNRVHNDSEREYDLGDVLTPFMTIVATKWSQSLTNLNISPMAGASGFVHRNSKFLTLLTDLHEIRGFHLLGCTTENNDEAARCMAKSWPKLKSLVLGVLRLPRNQTFVSLSTLRIIADNCPELHYLHIPLDISIIPPFDDFSTKNGPRHNLEFLGLGGPGGPGGGPPPDDTMLECQIQVARHLDFMFPYLKTINVHNEKWTTIRDLVKFCQDIRRIASEYDSDSE